MIKKILFGLFVVPLVLILAIGVVNFISAVISGDISLSTWILDHKLLLAIGLCFIAIRYLNPWRKA